MDWTLCTIILFKVFFNFLFLFRSHIKVSLITPEGAIVYAFTSNYRILYAAILGCLEHMFFISWLPVPFYYLLLHSYFSFKGTSKSFLNLDLFLILTFVKLIIALLFYYLRIFFYWDLLLFLFRNWQIPSHFTLHVH